MRQEDEEGQIKTSRLRQPWKGRAQKDGYMGIFSYSGCFTGADKYQLLKHYQLMKKIIKAYFKFKHDYSFILEKKNSYF